MSQDRASKLGSISRPISRRTVLHGGAALAFTAAALAFEPAAPAHASRGPKLRLAHRGTTKYGIYLGTGEDVVVRQAAAELASYLEQITSAQYDVIISDIPPSSQRLIVVGRANPLAAGIGAPVDYTALGDDGFALRSSNNGHKLLIAGPSSRGTLYGAYWVLDHLLGVRWFGADHTVVPSDPDLQIPQAQFSGDHVPRFRYRQILIGSGADPAYRQHNLLNASRQQPEGPPELNTWSMYWPERSNGNTFHEMVPDQTLWAGGQLACMDPRTREMAATNLVAAINARIADGKDASYGFEQQDAFVWSADPASRAFADAHGGALSAPVIDMVNDVYDRVRAQIPEARLSTQAYLFTFDPPTGITPDPDLVMTVAPLDADFGHSLLGPKNQAIADDIIGWCDISPNVLLWDYLTTYESFIQPFPDWFAAAEGIQDLAAHSGAQGYMGVGGYKTVGSEFADLRVWLLARLLWDPSHDVDALVVEFLNGYYGAAAPTIHQYMTMMVASVEATGAQLRWNDISTAGYLTFDAMRQADALLAFAETQVSAQPVLRSHVRNIRLGIDYIILMRRSEFRAAAIAQGVAWDPDTANRLVRFDAELDESGLTQNAEGGVTPAELKALVRAERTLPTPPATVAGLPDSDWVDFQDPSFQRSATITTLVEDTAASDHYAVRMAGSAFDWGVQLSLNSLPPGSTWKIYVSMRVDTGTAAGTDAAFTAGVWPPFGNETSVSVATMADGEYHEVALPGTYQTDAGRLVYIAAPGSSTVDAVFVDRMFAVKV